ncbi:hypothetical protein QFC22_005622 [Naganishia vaughanmartiniae]|uniref:Uncharacterized protein n=1 Tax=Naganishia vaughanmartiniae TaxID=1424756 RepID=A0ACC2WVA1_9TREE|nr:hypothetical protein QFC22_005622 [Naganishia vaughanmartiniae]
MISSFRDETTVTPSTHHITSSGNLISVHAKIQGPTAIVLHGRNIVEQDVILRGDLRGGGQGDEARALVMGRYCRVGEGSVLRPPGKISKGMGTTEAWPLAALQTARPKPSPSAAAGRS